MRVRSCGFDGLLLGAWPTVPGPYVFDCALGPLIDELPGSAGGVPIEGLVGDVEGLVAEGLLVADPGELAPGLLELPALPELLELPELLCAIATLPDSRRAASVTADVAFIVISMVAP